MADNKEQPDAREVLVAFFGDIRALRANAGNPSFREIGRAADCSHDTAHRLIEQEVLVNQTSTVGIAAALGGDREEWAARWAEAKTAERQIAAGAPEAESTPPDLPNGRPTHKGPAEKASRSRMRKTLLAVPIAAAVLAVGAVGISLGSDNGGGEEDSGLLFSRTCEGPINMGRQNDKCVREVQLLLKRAGGELAVDDSFGPETLRRVIAFQVLAGITPNGVVGDATKRALYDGEVKLTSWSKKRVERRIREVFPEAPDRAVAIARCQSNMDPLYILSNNDGTRNWGVFQLYEVRVKELGGTRRKALDPEWNIQAAHGLWKKHRDFRHWQCDKTFESAP